MQGFTRRAGQKLRIGEHIVVSVRRIRGGSVRLGFAVPPEMAVDREEIAEFKKRERVDANLSATRVAPAVRAVPDEPKASRAPRKTVRRSSADHPQGS